MIFTIRPVQSEKTIPILRQHFLYVQSRRNENCKQSLPLPHALSRRLKKAASYLIIKRKVKNYLLFVKTFFNRAFGSFIRTITSHIINPSNTTLAPR